jgi:hypothetical protein
MTEISPRWTQINTDTTNTCAILSVSICVYLWINTFVVVGLCPTVAQSLLRVFEPWW